MRQPADTMLFAAADVFAVVWAVILVRPQSAVVVLSLLVAFAVAVFRLDHTVPRLTLSYRREAGRAVRSASPPILMAGSLAAFGNRHPQWLTFGVLLVALCVAGRLAACAILMSGRRRGSYLRPALLAGGPDIDVLERVARAMREHEECGLRLVGTIGPWTLSGIPVVPFDALRQRSNMVGSCVVVATYECLDRQLVDLIEDAAGVHVYLTLRHLEATLSSPQCRDYLWTFPIGLLPTASKRWTTLALKRMMDVVLVIALLPLATLIMAVIAVAVRCSSCGPVLIRQLRVGRHGREFELLKFRTMIVQDDDLWSAAGSASVTAVGRLLRRSGLDELPQLVNVLRGEMSLVGPRPERPVFARRFASEIPGYGRRHRLAVGLTGLAQVSELRGDTSIVDRAHFDNRYIDHWSPLDDLAILGRTVGTLFRRGEH